MPRTPAAAPYSPFLPGPDEKKSASPHILGRSLSRDSNVSAESPTPQPDFIEVYDDALGTLACRRLIERFEASRLARRGETGGGVDVTVKDSWDIALHEHPGWSDAQQQLNDAVLVGFKRYLRRYPQMALATSRLQVPGREGAAPVTLDAERLARASNDLLDEVVMNLFRPGTINLNLHVPGLKPGSKVQLTFVDYDGNKGTVTRNSRMDLLKNHICPHHPADETYPCERFRSDNRSLVGPRLLGSGQWAAWVRAWQA